MLRLTQAENNVSTLEFKRHLGVSYPTAWLVKHKPLGVRRALRVPLRPSRPASPSDEKSQCRDR